jgi:RNA polymerase sigma-70 factor (ECF subfamily)
METRFAEAAEPLRREVLAHCYRMLGSAADAEDAVQETFLRAWRGFDRFEGRASVRTWLHRVATNVCLRMLEQRARRVLPADLGGPEPDWHGPARPAAAETRWLGPLPVDPADEAGQRQRLRLAFVAALQHLPARQRAVLLLRDVLGFSAREVADALETTVASANSALNRARRTLESRLPQESQQTALRTLGDERLRGLVRRLVDAMERSDVDAVVAQLTADATWSMPPDSTWYRGEALRAFLVDWPLTNRWRHLPARANGQPAIGSYMWDEQAGLFLPEALDVYTIRGDRIAAVTAFRTEGIFPRFGLPEEVRD